MFEASERSTVTQAQDDSPANLTARLIRAWWDWEHQPGSRAAAVAKEDALAAVGLPGCRMHAAIAANRARGMSISDAVETALTEGETVARGQQAAP